MMHIMDKHLLKHPTEGVVSMVDMLKDMGYPVGPKRIRRLFKLMGHQTIYRRKNLTKGALKEFIKPYLLRGLKITHANQVWCTDITYSVPGSLRDFIAVTRAHLKSALLQLCLVVQAYKPERQ
ncbi:MAG: hypothetical protein MUO54_09145 [Anaerolineales bacterium]|nr:hypothetical protein [Anaerolineales bacterium]